MADLLKRVRRLHLEESPGRGPAHGIRLACACNRSSIGELDRASHDRANALPPRELSLPRRETGPSGAVCDVTQTLRLAISTASRRSVRRPGVARFVDEAGESADSINGSGHIGLAHVHQRHERPYELAFAVELTRSPRPETSTIWLPRETESCVAAFRPLRGLQKRPRRVPGFWG